MTYNIYIQDNFVGTIDADNTSDVLVIVSKKITAKEYIVDESRPKNIKIEPTNE